MKTVIKQKQTVVNEIKEKLEKANVAIFCDYIGSNVALINKLRKDLKQNKAVVKVYKNTLTKRALNEANITCDQSFLSQNTALITSDDDAMNIIKLFSKFLKENETFKFKAGILEKDFILENDFKEIAKLPGRDELIAKLIGLIKSPISNLVMNLSSPIRGLVITLDQIGKNKA